MFLFLVAVGGFGASFSTELALFGLSSYAACDFDRSDSLLLQEPLSNFLVSALKDTVVLPYEVLYMTPFKEFRLWPT